MMDIKSAAPKNKDKPKPDEHQTSETSSIQDESSNSSKQVEKQGNLEQGKSNHWVAIIAIGCFIAVLSYFGIPESWQSQKVPKSKSCSFQELSQSDPQNEDVFNILSIGVENILNSKSQSAVYLFLHSNREWNNRKVLEIADQASSCFGKSSPVRLDSLDFSTAEIRKDFGRAIAQFKEKVKEGNVIFIVNLDKIPAEAAGALHPICDTYEPLVKNVVILVTLNCQNHSGNAVESAGDALHDLWGSKMNRSSLNPLITRLTDQVIALK